MEFRKQLHIPRNMCLLVDGGYPAIYPLLTRLLPNGSSGAWGSYYLPLGDQNFKQEVRTGALNFRLSDQWTNNKIPCSFCTFEMTMENVWSFATLLLPTEGKQTALCLEIRFCDFRCRAVEVSYLKMALNEFNSCRKTFDNKIMTFPSALETLGHYCMK